MIPVLDHGYVRLVDVLGNDLTVVNAARVSYDKESSEFNDKDGRLLAYLLKHGHTSPFRHAMLQFEVYAPLMVARQWWKYVIGSGHLEAGMQDNMMAWNESSRRYVTEAVVLHTPEASEWRTAPENSKQGSGGPVEYKIGQEATSRLLDLYERGVELYEWMQEQGIAAEQARLAIPSYGMYVRWRWTASLAGVMHFLDQRLEHDAQYEIQQYARAVAELTTDAFPNSMEARNGAHESNR